MSGTLIAAGGVARRRCDVLFAMLKDKELYRAPAVAAPAAA